jgi:hypothetical protein
VRKLTAERDLVVVNSGEHRAAERLAPCDLHPVAQLDPLL